VKIERLAFGSFALVDGDGKLARFGPLVPGNDLLGLRAEHSYIGWLEERWGTEASGRHAMRWVRSGAIDELVEIAHATEGQRVPYAKLAPFLERLRFDRGGGFQAPDLPALAAWSIERAASSGVPLTDCTTCGKPRFGRGLSPYCSRPAPGQITTCAQLHAQERFAEERAEWNKEYRRIYARKLRGSVSDQEWENWREDPYGSARAPEIYTPFDRWRTPEYRDEVQRFERQRQAMGLPPLRRTEPDGEGFKALFAFLQSLRNEEDKDG
jgi:hypothetical protein